MIDKFPINNPDEKLESIKETNDQFCSGEVTESESSSLSAEEEIISANKGDENSTESANVLLTQPKVCFAVEEPLTLSEEVLPLLLTRPLAHRVQLVEEQAYLIDALVINQHDHVQISNQIYDWFQPDLKEQSKKLILNYQKHLSKNYFFRSKGIDTRNKIDAVNKLLSYLEKDYGIFKACLNEIDSKKTFSVHRDSLLVQKIGKFFKRHEKTKGEQLVEKLISLTEKDFILRE